MILKYFFFILAIIAFIVSILFTIKKYNIDMDYKTSLDFKDLNRKVVFES